MVNASQNLDQDLLSFLKDEQCCSPKFICVLFRPTCIHVYFLILKDNTYHFSFSCSEKKNKKKSLKVAGTFQHFCNRQLYWKVLLLLRKYFQVYERRGLDPNVEGDTIQTNKEISNENRIIQLYITPMNRQILWNGVLN